MKQTSLILAVIALTTLSIRVPLAGVPLERDEGEYAYIAWRLDYHELPYRDWIDQKPPAIFWVYWLALRLPFSPVRSIHLMGALFSAATACGLFFVARRFLNWFWAAAAAVLLGLLSADPWAQGLSANTELFMLLPLVLSELAFLSAANSTGRRGAMWAVLAGVLTSAAVLFKQVAAVNWLFQLALFPVLVERQSRLRNTLRFAGASLAGLLVVWGLVGAYFWLRQGLGDLMANVFTHNLEYINVIPWSERLKSAAKAFAGLSRSQALAWGFAAAGFIWLGIKGQKPVLFFLAGWLVSSLAGVAASGYFFAHYFQQALPPLCVAAALGAEALAGARWWAWAPGWAPKAALAAALAVLPGLVLGPFLFSYSPPEIVRRIYPGNPFAEMPALGSRVAEITAPEQRIFVFGSEPELLFYARRASATRYIFLFPLYGPYRDARRKQMAAAEEVTRAQPAAALFMPNVLFLLPGSDQYFSQWSYSYLRENFLPDTYLTLDRAGVVHVVCVAGQPQAPLPVNHQMIGSLLARKEHR